MRFDYDVFIEGTTVDLCVPTEEIAYHSNWYNFFNQKRITKLLEQGLFPNTREDQVAFLKSEKASRKRLLLLIITKESRLMKGVISLSKINFEKNTADLALVLDDRIAPRSTRLASLESVALITEHAFEVMRLERIYAKQSRSLENWQRRMELLGYRVEGIHKADFYEKRDKKSNSVSIACTVNDYQKILESRGSLFDSEEAMLRRIKSLPEESAAEQLEKFLENSYREYYIKIWK